MHLIVDEYNVNLTIMQSQELIYNLFTKGSHEKKCG